MGVSTRFALAATLGPMLALAACNRPGPLLSNGAVAPASDVQAGGAARWGNSIASMADLYNRPHVGPYSATGASAWVPPSPPPAYVDTSPPPPRAPEPPPLAAVRNRTPADDVPRPEAGGVLPAPATMTAARAQPSAALTPAAMAKGRQLFGANGCGGCHTLADAGASGSVGPGFDRNPGLSPAYVFNTVHDGRNSMPSFAGQISDADIRTLANYIVAAAKK